MTIIRACAVIGAVALGSPAVAQQQLSIATGGTGGTYFPLGGGLAELITTRIDGYAAVAEVTGASVENMAYIHNGSADLAIALGDSIYQAYSGTGAFEGRQIDTLALAALYPNAVQFVVPADSPIQSVSDFVGRRISVGAPGSGTEVNALAVLNGNEIQYSDFSATQRLNYNESADAIRDGIIDAGTWSASVPNGSIMSLAVTRNIRLIPLSPEEIANAMELEPIFAEYTIPAGTYEGITEDVPTVGIPNALVVHGEMEDDLAYEITKLLHEEIAYLRAIHPSANDTTLEFAVDASPIPLHPGAIRYYEEVGIEIPDDLRP